MKKVSKIIPKFDKREVKINGKVRMLAKTLNDYTRTRTKAGCHTA